MNGQPESANAFLVNGGDVSETKNMGAGLIPNLDSVQEFRLITNTFDAEYGKFTGAVMNTITKSGTNSIHGTFFEFLRNVHLDARNYYDPTRANLHRNQFGYAIGGPFWKNKLFWFSDYQGTRQVSGAGTGQIQLPSVTQRAGNFGAGAFGDNTVNGAGWAQVLSKRLGYTVTNGESYNSVFPTGVIPTAAFDPVAVNEMKYIPSPNINPATGLYSNSSTKNSVVDTNLGERVDFVNQMTGNWSFYYHYDDSTALNALGGLAYVGTPPLPGFPTTQPSRNQLFMVSNTKTLGPTSVNVARFTFFRTAVHTAQPSDSTTVSLASLGFTTGPGTLGIVPTGPVGYPESVPPDNFNNYSFGNNWLNLFQVDNNYMLSDTFSKTKGKHSLSFGGEYRYYQLNVRNICGPHGYFVFNGTETSIDYADFLLGAPAQYVQCSEQYLDNRAAYGGLFAQDSFKVMPNLTLNLGLRYEVASPWWDTIGQLTTVVPGVQSVVFPTAPLGYLVPGDPGVPRTISPTRWNNFAPRIGAAYSPSAPSGFLHALFGGPGQSSIRAAYGIYYLGAADIGNFGIIGDAPWGLYWQSIAPPTFDQPFVTRATQASQGQRFPFTFPSPGGTHPGYNFNQFLPLFSPGYATYNKLTYAEHYNLSIQRQLSKSTIFTIAYIGTQSHRIQLTDNLIIGNGPLCLQLAAEGCGPGGETSVYTLPNGSNIYGTLQGSLNNQALGPQYGGVVVYGQANLDANIGNSNFNSLQTTLERRAADLTFLIAYTYGKSFDNVSTTLNVLNPKSSYVISPFDITNNFVASYSWMIPFDRAFSNAPGRLTQGWSLNGITRFASGFPITLSQSGDVALTGLGIDFPNIAGPIQRKNPRAANVYFLPNAFSTELPGIVGNSGARYFHGPGTINTDFGASKNTNITEGTSLMLRAEFFNLFNHTNFTGVNGNFASSQFGQVTNTLPARVGQVSAKFMF